MLSMLNMINTSNMIKASDLKVGDKIIDNDSKEYLVVCNRCHAPVERLILRECGTLDNIALFYNEDVDYAKDILNIDLSLV